MYNIYIYIYIYVCVPEPLKKSSYGHISGVDSHFECAEFAVRHASHPRASERGDAVGGPEKFIGLIVIDIFE